MAGPHYKRKRKTINNAYQSKAINERQSFQAGGKNTNIESYLVNNKCKFVNEMSLSGFITGL